MPKLSRGATILCLALFAALLLVLPAAAEEAPAVDEAVVPALDRPACGGEEPLPFLGDEVTEAQAASCTCPAEGYACSFDFECDAYCLRAILDEWSNYKISMPQ